MLGLLKVADYFVILYSLPRVRNKRRIVLFLARSKLLVAPDKNAFGEPNQVEIIGRKPEEGFEASGRPGIEPG